MPFLPLYIAELGTTDIGEITLWTGLILGATPTVTAISAPLWGRVGDKYGSKLLVIRSLTAFILTKAAMAFVTAPWQLFALRALLGVFAGYGALTMSMAAQSVPRDKMAEAIGTVQTGHRLGPAIGPVIGGLLAPIVGLRNAFLVASTFYIAAMLLIIFFYKEPLERRAEHKVRGGWEVFTQLIRQPGFLLALFVIFGLQTVDRSFGPVLPLFVSQVGVDDARIPLVAGVLFSLGAISAAAGSQLAPRLLKRRTPKFVIVIGTITASVALAAIVIAPSVGILAVSIVIAGVAMGASTTAIYSVAGGAAAARRARHRLRDHDHGLAARSRREPGGRGTDWQRGPADRLRGGRVSADDPGSVGDARSAIETPGWRLRGCRTCRALVVDPFLLVLHLPKGALGFVFVSAAGLFR